MSFLVIGGSVSGEFGDEVLLGDIGGGNALDLVVADTDHGTGGAVFIILDPDEGNHTASDADIVITGETGSRFGSSIALADMDDDNMTDLIVGAPNASNGEGIVYIFLSPSGNLTYEGADHNVTADSDIMGFGATVEAIEYSGDNRTDLAIASIYRPDGNGLIASYYDDMVPEDREYMEVVEGIGFDWGTGAPNGLEPDTYMIRWTGYLYVEETGDHTFWAEMDDGVRVYIDGETVIDVWNDGVWNLSGSKYLLEGYHDIQVDYYENTGGAQAWLNWTTPSGGGPIPVDNLVPALSYPLSLVKGKTNLSNLVVSDVLIGGLPTSSLGSTIEPTENGVAIGSWSSGHVYYHDFSETTDLQTFYAYPQYKGSSDETGEPVNDLWGDDNNHYEVGPDSDEDDMEIDTFYIYQLTNLAREYGEIESVELLVRYKTDQYYVWNGNGDLNWVRIKPEGGNYQDVVQPTRSTSERDLSGNVMNKGIDTFSKIEDANVAFNNGDRGSGWIGKDSVYFEYLLIEIEVMVPIMNNYVEGPVSFGSSVAIDAGTMYVGAPSAGPFDNDLALTGGSGGSAFVFNLTTLPAIAAQADDMILGPKGSELGSSIAASNGTFAIGAPGAFVDRGTGAVFLAEDGDLSGSGICPYTVGTAGTSVDLFGTWMAAGNPGMEAVHLVDMEGSPTVDLENAVMVYPPQIIDTEADVLSDTTLNVTAYAAPSWDMTLEGSQWYRTGTGTLDLQVDADTDPGEDTALTVVGRSGDGLICGIDTLWIRTDGIEHTVEDLQVLRTDGMAFSPPEGGVAGEVSTIRPYIGYSGPDTDEHDVSIYSGASYFNRTVPLSTDVVVLGDLLTVDSYGTDLWKAEDQFGTTFITTSLPDRHRSWRVVVAGAHILQRGDSVRLEFYSPVDLTFDQVSIAVSAGDTKNIKDDTLVEVSFGGETYYTASAGESFTSDWTDFTMDPKGTYAVSFHTQTRGSNSLSYYTGNAAGYTYSREGDYRSDRDWSDDSLFTWDYSAYLVTIERETYPSEVAVDSLPIHSGSGFTSIGWTGTVPDGADIKALIRTADDVGGMPAKWTDWRGPSGEEPFDTPSVLTESAQWAQYRVILISNDGYAVPALESFYLGTATGDMVQYAWNAPGGLFDGSSDHVGYRFIYPVDSLWTASSGNHDITVMTGGDSDVFTVDMESNLPNGPLTIQGQITDILNQSVQGASVVLTNLRTGEDLSTSTDGSGDYSFDPTVLTSGYQDGDLFTINASNEGAVASETFFVYSEDGDKTIDLIILLDGMDVYLELQDTPYGQSYIRMYRQSDGNETDTPVNGEGTRLTARVGNRGIVQALDVSLAFFDNGSMIGSAQVIDLAPGEVQQVEQWWFPDEGWTNLSFKAWGMWNQKHFMWTDLWDDPRDWGSPVDFTSDAYNTPYDNNTFFIDGGDPDSSHDGWDWEVGAYGSTDDTQTEFGDPSGDSDYVSTGRIEIKIAESGSLTGKASGAWGTQFYIDQKAIDGWSSGKAYLNLTYWFDNFDDDLDEDACIVGRLRNDTSVLWLGSDTNPFDTSNSSIFTKASSSDEELNIAFSQEIGSFITGPGHYYIDLGVILDSPSSGAAGVGAYFDDISLELMKNVYDLYGANDEAWYNITVLPEQPAGPYNATINFYDNYNLTAIEANFTAMVDDGSTWLVSDQANASGQYALNIPAANYTESAKLTIEVDDVWYGVRYRGGVEMSLYSYESPTDIDIPLFSYEYELKPGTTYGETVPNGTLGYGFEVDSNSNVAILVDLNVTDLPEDWNVTLSGTNVTGSGTEYHVLVDAYSSVMVTTTLQVAEDPLDALPGNYTWFVNGSTWFATDSVEMTTKIIPDLSFEIENVGVRTILPDGTLAYNVTVVSTGNVENKIDFNLTTHTDWDHAFVNTTLVLGAAETSYVLFNLTAPGWPDDNMTAGTNHSFQFYGDSRYGSETDWIPIDLQVGELHGVWFNGTDMTCFPGVEIKYSVIAINDGNVDEEVALTLDWNSTQCNVSAPQSETVRWGYRKAIDVFFRASPDLNVSKAGMDILVNASYLNATFTLVFTVGPVNIVHLPEPDLVETVIGKETEIDIWLENRGNGETNFTIEVKNGEPDVPYTIMSPWEPGTVLVKTTPDHIGWSNLTVIIKAGGYKLDEIEVPVYVTRGDLDMVLGDRRKVLDDIDAYDVAAGGDLAYISSGYIFYRSAAGEVLNLGETNATEVSLTVLDNAYIALNGPVLKVLEISRDGGTLKKERTWKDFGNASRVEIGSSEYSANNFGLYILWINSEGVVFRSLSDLGGSVTTYETDVWTGTAYSIDMMARDNEIFLTWGAKNGVHFASCRYTGAFRTDPNRVVKDVRPRSVALAHYEDPYVAWSAAGMTLYSTYQGGAWTDPEVVGPGEDVAGAMDQEHTTFAMVEGAVIVQHVPEGFWQASGRGEVSSPTILSGEELEIYYLDDHELWMNTVGSPLMMDWNGSVSRNVTLENHGIASGGTDPVLVHDVNWTSSMAGVSVLPDGTGGTVLNLTAPTNILADPYTVVSVSINGIELAAVPAYIIDPVIHDISVARGINATPGWLTNSTLTLLNTGNAYEEVEIEYYAPDGWEVFIEDTTLSVVPGGNATTNISVLVPEDTITAYLPLNLTYAGSTVHVNATLDVEQLPPEITKLFYPKEIKTLLGFEMNISGLRVLDVTWTLPNGSKVSGDVVNVTLNTPGVGMINVTISNDAGSDSREFNITVLNRNPVDLDFDAIGLVMGKNTKLIGYGTDPEGSDVTFTWRIDGQELSGKEVKFKFKLNGTYEIVLVVKDEHGGKTTFTRVVDIAKAEEEEEKGMGLMAVAAVVPIIVILLLLLLLVKRRKKEEPEDETEPTKRRSAKDAAALKKAKADWEVAFERVWEVDRNAARAFRGVTVLELKDTTNVLKLELPEGHRGEIPSELKAVMENEYSEVRGTRTFLFIEGGPDSKPTGPKEDIVLGPEHEDAPSPDGEEVPPEDDDVEYKLMPVKKGSPPAGQEVQRPADHERPSPEEKEEAPPAEQEPPKEEAPDAAGEDQGPKWGRGHDAPQLPGFGGEDPAPLPGEGPAPEQPPAKGPVKRKIKRPKGGPGS